MKLDSVEICENFTRNDIIKKFDQLQKESDEFEAANENNYQAIMGIYINWIGYVVHIYKYDDLYDLLDERIYPYDFQMD